MSTFEPLTVTAVEHDPHDCVLVTFDTSAHAERFAFRHGHDAERRITLRYGNGPATLALGGREFSFATSPSEQGRFDLTLDGVKTSITAIIEGHELYLRTRNGRFELHWVDPFGGETVEQTGEDRIVAPLPGTVVAVLAEEGAKLEKGAAILTLTGPPTKGAA